MLLQTNSYVVPREKRAEHSRLVRRFRQTMGRLGCDQFDVFEQVGANWSTNETTGRFVQMMRFRDRKHQLAVQAAEKQDPGAQALIAEFCELINFPYQQQQGLFAVGFYQSVLPVTAPRAMELPDAGAAGAAEGAVEYEAASDAGYETEPVQDGEPYEQHGTAAADEIADDRSGLRLVESEPLGDDEIGEALRAEGGLPPGEALGDDIDIAEVIDVPNNGEDRPGGGNDPAAQR